MEFVVKVSTDYNNIVAQFMNPRDLRYVRELQSFNNCSFTLGINDDQINNVTKYKKVQVFSISAGAETLLWSGYISSLKMGFHDVFVTCSDEKRYVMTKKILFEDKSWSSESVENVLDEILGEANARANLVADLQSHYLMDDNAASTTVLDSYGSENGTAQQNTENMSSVGKAKNSLHFNGSTDYITLSSSSNFGIVSGSFTVSAWVNLASITGDKAIIGHDNAVANQSLFLGTRDGKPYLGFYGDDLQSDTVLDTGKWYHLTFVYDDGNGTQSIYINGVLDKSTSGHSAMTGTGTLYIGQWNTSGRMHGQIDELRIYDDVKVQSEITELYSSLGYKHGYLSYETDLSDTITRDYDKGSQYGNIFSDFEQDFTCEIDVIANKVYVKTTIGQDRTTSGDSFIELISNVNSPVENTITNLIVTDNGEEIFTSVIAKDDAGYEEATNNTDLYGFLETAQTFNDGELSTQAANWISENSEGSITFDSDVVPNVDFRNINIGDLVKLRVERGADMIDVTASIKVIYKEVIIDNGVPKYTVKLSENPTKIFSAQNYISKLANRVQRQELK